MKRIYLLFSAALLLILAASCNSSVLFDEEHVIADAKWNRFSPEEFHVKSNSVDDYYDLYVTVSVDTNQYRLNSLPVNINLYSPNGERRMFPSTVTLRKSNGQWNGTFEGSVLTCSQRVRDCFCFNTEGDYKVEVGQATHYYDITGVKSIAFKVLKTKLEYPE